MSDSTVPSEKKEIEEHAFCRVCHGEAEPDKPLYFPCKCDGSIKYVHQECLMEWLKVSKKTEPKCELCGEKFHFQNIYSAEALVPISVVDLAMELLPRLMGTLSTGLRRVFSAMLWGILLPVFSNWWVQLCWCTVSTVTNKGRCIWKMNKNKLSTGSVEELVSFWFTGLVYICIAVATSIVILEIVNAVYKVTISIYVSI